MDINRHTFLESGRYRNLTLESVDETIALRMYVFMRRLRMLQERIMKEYHPANEMRCPVHFVIGQEAAPAALHLALRSDDHLFGSHRSHGYFLAKGASMKGLLAEIYGKSTGVNGGKAGSQEVSSHSVNFHSGAILSGALGMAAGAAMGFQLQKKDCVAVGCLGDGAVDEGVFWEAISYAQLCKLPVIFLCENNGFSTYSPLLKRQPADNIHERVGSFGMPSEAIFGNDAPLIYTVLSRAVEKARSGNGPTFIETYTSRWFGHVGPEDDDYVGYRTKEELEAWRANCPVSLLEERLVEKGWLSKESADKMAQELSAEIDEAFTYARKSAFPVPSDWKQQNSCLETPFADRLLADLSDPGSFDFDQNQAIPGPY